MSGSKPQTTLKDIILSQSVTERMLGDIVTHDAAQCTRRGVLHRLGYDLSRGGRNSILMDELVMRGILEIDTSVRPPTYQISRVVMDDFVELWTVRVQRDTAVLEALGHLNLEFGSSEA